MPADTGVRVPQMSAVVIGNFGYVSIVTRHLLRQLDGGAAS
jgi:hypothetical protein